MRGVKTVAMSTWKTYSYRDSVEYCQDRGSCVSGIYQQDRKDLAASLTGYPCCAHRQYVQV
jgi:hypothetical protein